MGVSLPQSNGLLHSHGSYSYVHAASLRSNVSTVVHANTVAPRSKATHNASLPASHTMVHAMVPAASSPTVTNSGPIYQWGFLNPNAQLATPQAKSLAKMFKSPPVDIHKLFIPDPIVRGEDLIIRIDDAL